MDYQALILPMQQTSHQIGCQFIQPIAEGGQQQNFIIQTSFIDISSESPTNTLRKQSKQDSIQLKDDQNFIFNQFSMPQNSKMPTKSKSISKKRGLKQKSKLKQSFQKQSSLNLIESGSEKIEKVNSKYQIKGGIDVDDIQSLNYFDKQEVNKRIRQKIDLYLDFWQNCKNFQCSNNGLNLDSTLNQEKTANLSQYKAQCFKDPQNKRLQDQIAQYSKVYTRGQAKNMSIEQFSFMFESDPEVVARIQQGRYRYRVENCCDTIKELYTKANKLAQLTKATVLNEPMIQVNSQKHMVFKKCLKFQLNKRRFIYVD